MNKTYILVEGETDAHFLRRILPNEALTDANIVVVGRSIPSFARSVLVSRSSPVAVVMDADSLDPDLIEERRQSTQELIRAANASVPVIVVPAVPEMEAWLFAAPAAIERVFGAPFPSEFITWGQRDPKGVLRKLAEVYGPNWDTKRAIDSLDAEDVERIRALSAVQELIGFLKNARPDEKAA